jgi:hypothetical protein
VGVGRAQDRGGGRGRRRAGKKRTRPQLSEGEREQLRELTRRGHAGARVFKRARILELIDAGFAMQDIPVAVGVGEVTVRRVRLWGLPLRGGRRYEEGGVERALYDRPRPGGQPRLSAKQEQRIVAMVCGPPPAGRARWTVRRITEEVIRGAASPSRSAARRSGCCCKATSSSRGGEGAADCSRAESSWPVRPRGE